MELKTWFWIYLISFESSSVHSAYYPKILYDIREAPDRERKSSDGWDFRNDLDNCVAAAAELPGNPSTNGFTQPRFYSFREVQRENAMYPVMYAGSCKLNVGDVYVRRINRNDFNVYHTPAQELLLRQLQQQEVLEMNESIPSP